MQIINKKLFRSFIGMLVVVVFQSANALDKLRWKVPDNFPSHLTPIGDNVNVLAEPVNEMPAAEILFKNLSPAIAVRQPKIDDQQISISGAENTDIEQTGG